MNVHLTDSISHARRTLGVTTLALFVGTVTAFAQAGSTYGTGSAGSSSTDTSRRNTSSATSSANPSTSSSSKSSTYGSGTTGASASGTSSRDASVSASSTGSMSTSADKLSWGDKRFVTKVADSGQAEVELAQLAADRATSPDVKQFAQRLVTDHTKVNQELMSMASTKRVEIEKDEGKDRFYRRLSNKSGSDFDREFVEHMIDSHENSIKMFEKTSQDAKDEDVRSFASKHVGHLREHLQQAQSLQASLVPTGREDDNAGGSASAARSTSGATPASTTNSDATSAERSNSSTGTSASGADRSRDAGSSGATSGGSSSSGTRTDGGR